MAVKIWMYSNCVRTRNQQRLRFLSPIIDDVQIVERKSLSVLLHFIRQTWFRYFSTIRKVTKLFKPNAYITTLNLNDSKTNWTAMFEKSCSYFCIMWYFPMIHFNALLLYELSLSRFRTQSEFAPLPLYSSAGLVRMDLAEHKRKQTERALLETFRRVKRTGH